MRSVVKWLMSLMPVAAWGTGERLVYKFFKDIQDNEIRTGIDMAKCYSYFRAERNPVLPIYITVMTVLCFIIQYLNYKM